MSPGYSGTPRISQAPQPGAATSARIRRYGAAVRRARGKAKDPSARERVLSPYSGSDTDAPATGVPASASSICESELMVLSAFATLAMPKLPWYGGLCCPPS